MNIDDLGKQLSDHVKEQATRHTEICERLAIIETAGKGLPARVDSLEASRDRQRGIAYVLGVLWVGCVAVVGFILGNK